MFLLDVSFCEQSATVWRVIGYLVLVIKIVIPLILIVLGMVDLGKAVVANKDDEINNSVKRLIKRFIAAVIIFFIPTIVSALFSVITGAAWGREGTDANKCVQCVTNPNGGVCSKAVSASTAQITWE